MRYLRVLPGVGIALLRADPEPVPSMGVEEDVINALLVLGRR